MRDTNKNIPKQLGFERGYQLQLRSGESIPSHSLAGVHLQGFVCRILFAPELVRIEKQIVMTDQYGVPHERPFMPRAVARQHVGEPRLFAEAVRWATMRRLTPFFELERLDAAIELVQLQDFALQQALPLEGAA